MLLISHFSFLISRFLCSRAGALTLAVLCVIIGAALGVWFGHLTFPDFYRIACP